MGTLRIDIGLLVEKDSAVLHGYQVLGMREKDRVNGDIMRNRSERR